MAEETIESLRAERDDFKERYEHLAETRDRFDDYNMRLYRHMKIMEREEKGRQRMVLEKEELANEVLRLQEEVEQLRGNLTLKCEELRNEKGVSAHLQAGLAALLEKMKKLGVKDA